MKLQLSFLVLFLAKPIFSLEGSIRKHLTFEQAVAEPVHPTNADRLPVKESDFSRRLNQQLHRKLPFTFVDYTSSANFIAASGPLLHEDWSDTTLVPGLSYVSATGATISDGKFKDIVHPGSPAGTVFTYTPKTFEFGVKYNLDPGGLGTGISVKVDVDGTYIGDLPYSSGWLFWGFISNIPFEKVTFTATTPPANPYGIQETYWLDDMWISNQPCVLTSDPALMYTSTTVNYALSIDSNIVVTVGGSPLTSTPAATTYEAVVYAANNGDCDLDTVLGKTPNAHIADGVTVPATLPFSVDATTTPGQASITAPVDSFAFPVTYSQDQPCSNLVGGATNPETDQCGVLEVCVEYQQHVCGEKIDFLDVYIEVEFDLTAECQDCLLAYLQRAATVDEGFDVDEVPITCGLCPGAPYPPIFNQGDVIDVCVEYDVQSLPDGICMLSTVWKFLVRDYPQVGLNTEYDLLALPAGWFYGPGGEVCSDPFTPYTECHIPFVPAGGFYQLLAPEETVEAKLTVTSLSGYGCWCDTVDVNNNGIPDTCEDPSRRQLMGSGIVQQTVTVDIDFTTEGDEPLGFFEMIMQFLATLLSFLTFGLLG